MQNNQIILQYFQKDLKVGEIIVIRGFFSNCFCFKKFYEKIKKKEKNFIEVEFENSFCLVREKN